jgi:hypothetical protein
MGRKIQFLFLLAAIAISIISCERKSEQVFSFAFYNVENLFDTIDDPNINDESYLPTSKVYWNTERYNHKLDNLSRVMSSIDPKGYPSIFGICEVENLSVVQDLISHFDMTRANYNIVHKDSPDERGIDVAMLYDPKVYTPIENRFIDPDLWDITDSSKVKSRTRDILYSKGMIFNKDTLHVFVNHWVSRWGGQEATEPHRIKIAETIRALSDSILRHDKNANIIIAGDLNDNPTDVSIKEHLKALVPKGNLSNTELYNLSEKIFTDSDTVGTLYYKSWDVFDQIIVSGAMLTGSSGLKVDKNEQTIFKEEWMLYQPKNGPARPSRTGSSRNYYGGFSDHLPVMINIKVE